MTALTASETLRRHMPTAEAALCAAFRERTHAGDLEMVSALRPHLRAVVRSRWPSLWLEVEDLEQSALVRLFDLRNERPERVRPTLAQLAAALVHAPAKVLRRRPRTSSLEGWDQGRDARQETAFRLRRVAELAVQLPRRQSTTLLAHVAHLTGEGPPLAHALGIDPKAAKARLLRAQAALYRRLRKRELEVNRG